MLISCNNMEYKIKGFVGYLVTDERQIIKKRQTPKGEKISIVSTVRPRKDCEYEYARLTRKENDKSVRYTFPVDEIIAAAKSGVELGTPESRAVMKKYRHEISLMGKVSSAIGNVPKEQEIVNMLHIDLVRQMKNVGINADVDNLAVFVVSQLLFDFLRICSEASKTPITYKVKTKNGEVLQEHVIWQMKRKFFDQTISGLRALGLTYEKVIKQLPEKVFDDINSLMEEKERERKAENLGIVWNE